jgi:hypothetical protein
MLRMMGSFLNASRAVVGTLTANMFSLLNLVVDFVASGTGCHAVRALTLPKPRDLAKATFWPGLKWMMMQLFVLSLSPKMLGWASPIRLVRIASVDRKERIVGKIFMIFRWDGLVSRHAMD